MRNYIIYLFALIFYSCDIPYDLETRYIFETKIVDSNGDAISNKELKVYVSTENKGETISKAMSNQEGFIRIIFPKPDLEAYTFSIISENDDTTGFLEKNILNIKQEDFIDYKLVIEDIKLMKYNELTNLYIELNQVNQNNILKKVEIVGEVYNPNEYYNPIVNLDYYDIATYFLLHKNQNFNLKYTVYNTLTMLEDQTILNLTIANQPVTYTLNY